MVKKQCTVAIVGLPNAGKSTFLNNLIKHKVSIVSYKPQTTRNQIQAIYTNKNIDICFIDTPGFHQPKNKLDSFLNSQINQSFKQSDIVLLLIDLTRDSVDENKKLINLIKSYKVNNLLVAFSHKDLAKSINIEDKIRLYGLNNGDEYLTICCNNYNDLLDVVNKIYLLSPINGFFNIIGNNDDFLIKETIREVALHVLRQEVPHCIAVSIDDKKFNKITNLFTITCSLILEKETQKSIVIGKNGNMIKLIGIKSRNELLKLYDCKIMLNLFVKVRKNWRNNETMLKDLGYFKK